MPTFDPTKAGLYGITVQLKTKIEELDKLYAKYRGTDGVLKAVPSAEDQVLIESLETEIADLTAQHEVGKKAEDADKANRARLKSFAPNRMRFSVGPVDDIGIEGPSDARKSHTPARRYGGSLKHIDICENRQQNEELAYKFFQFFAATQLPANTAIQQKAWRYCEEHAIPTVKTLNESANAEGGALVPAEFDPMLIRLIEQHGVFRQSVRIVLMASDTRLQPRRTGGVTANWIGEGKPIPASNPAYDNVQLVAKKLAALTVMSSEISEDAAINIADELAFEIGYAFALSEDRAGFFGDATSQHGGIAGIVPKLTGLDGSIANIAGLRLASGNLFSEFVLDDFSQTVALLPQYADTSRAGWYCHRGFYFGVMQRIELEQGGVTMNETAQGDRRPRPLFLGYPVNFAQVFPRNEANSTVFALLGDLSLGCMMGDRRIRSLFTDPYSLSANDQIQVRGTERIDIVVHDVGNASATPALREPGPIVGLISAAA